MKALLILAAVMTSPLYAQTSASPNPKPIGHPSTWVGEYDYPAAALVDRPEGTVGFSLSVDGAGRVTACLVRQSSGFAELDTATCAILARRARFKPEPGAGSSPRVYKGSVRWLAPDYPAGGSGSAAFATMKEDDEFGR